MSRVLICEPVEHVRELLAHVVARLGHHPVTVDGHVPELPAVDAVIVEPAYAPAVALTLALRAVRQELPVICVSICERTPQTSFLNPVAYVVKPFSLAEMSAALRAALRSPVVAPQ